MIQNLGDRSLLQNLINPCKHYYVWVIQKSGNRICWKPLLNLSKSTAYHHDDPAKETYGIPLWSLSKRMIVQGCKNASKTLINVVEKVCEIGTPDLRKPVKSLYNPCQNGGLWKAAKSHSKTTYKRCENECLWKRHSSFRARAKNRTRGRFLE